METSNPLVSTKSNMRTLEILLIPRLAWVTFTGLKNGAVLRKKKVTKTKKIEVTQRRSKFCA